MTFPASSCLLWKLRKEDYLLRCRRSSIRSRSFRVCRIRLFGMVWSLIVILKVRSPSDHRAHPTHGRTSYLPTYQSPSDTDKAPEVTPATDPSIKRVSSDVETPGRKLRRREPTATAFSLNRPSKSKPPLSPSLKAAIVAKSEEWLAANETGRGDIADPIEEELEALEQQALSLNAGAFRTWRTGGFRMRKAGTSSEDKA